MSFSSLIQLLLLGAQLIAGLAAQLIDLGERTEEALPAAHADQIGAAREVVDGVRRGSRRCSPRRRAEALTEHVLRANPQRVRKDVGVGHEDDVGIFLRLR